MSTPHPSIEKSKRDWPAEGPNLLVVEDERDVRVLLQHMVRERYRSDAVPSARAAFRKAEQETYDGFLIDITLHGKRNGVDVLEGLRDQERYQNTPMIAVTAHAMPGDRERFLQAGFDAYLSKPFRQADLLALLDQLFVDTSRVKPRPLASEGC